MNNPPTESTNMRSWQEGRWEITPFNIPVLAVSPSDVCTRFILRDFLEERQFVMEFQAWDTLSDEALMNIEMKQNQYNDGEQGRRELREGKRLTFEEVFGDKNA